MFLSICSEPDVLNLFRILFIILDIIKIVVPVLIIIFLIVDYSKIVVKGQNINETNIHAFKRFIAALLIFLIPTLFEFFNSFVGNDFDYNKCFVNANLDGINQAYRDKIDKYIDEAFASLSYDDLNEVKEYYSQLNKSLKEDYEDILIELERKVDIYNDVGKIISSDGILSSYSHDRPFFIKIQSDKNVFYCVDDNGECEPDTLYSNPLWFVSEGSKSLVYKVCNEDIECSKLEKYKVFLKYDLFLPTSSTSWGGFENYYHAAYYYQDDARWADYDVNNGVTFGTVGCGYAAYAMLMSGIAKDSSITPLSLFEKLVEIRKKYGVEFQSLATGGGLLNEAIHNNEYMKDEYRYDTTELWNDYEYSTTDEVKKERIVNSLKMGNMIFIRVPVHFISLIGIDENENILIFDPGWKSWKLDIDTFYSTYYDYNNNCTDGEECGFKIAYEVYEKKSNSSLYWFTS